MADILLIAATPAQNARAGNRPFGRTPTPVRQTAAVRDTEQCANLGQRIEGMGDGMILHSTATTLVAATVNMLCCDGNESGVIGRTILPGRL
jgi:hypothetical protein